jgi:hypothetical protein
MSLPAGSSNVLVGRATVLRRMVLPLDPDAVASEEAH